MQRWWLEQGAQIMYLSSHRLPDAVAQDEFVINKWGFPLGQVFSLSRGPGETYAQVAERIMPDALIEDDCQSIGGGAEMVYPHVRSDLRQQMTSFVVREFEGIDHLPDDLPTPPA